jgi:hypothetical protein
MSIAASTITPVVRLFPLDDPHWCLFRCARVATG